MSLLLKTASIASSGTIKTVQEWGFSLNSWRLTFFCPIAKVGGVLINSILLFYVAMVCKQRIKVARLFQRTFRLPWQINSREISCEWPLDFQLIIQVCWKWHHLPMMGNFVLTHWFVCSVSWSWSHLKMLVTYFATECMFKLLKLFLVWNRVLLIVYADLSLALWSVKGPSHSSCHGAVHITFCNEFQSSLINLIFLDYCPKLNFPKKQVYKNIFSVE